jgi:hypothetical protein
MLSDDEQIQERGVNVEVGKVGCVNVNWINILRIGSNDRILISSVEP